MEGKVVLVPLRQSRPDGCAGCRAKRLPRPTPKPPPRAANPPFAPPWQVGALGWRVRDGSGKLGGYTWMTYAQVGRGWGVRGGAAGGGLAW
jgi:hypothetical protein